MNIIVNKGARESDRHAHPDMGWNTSSSRPLCTASEAHSSLICCTGESHSSTRIVFSQRRPSVLALTCPRQQQGKDIGQTQPARALYEPRFFRIADIAISAASPPT